MLDFEPIPDDDFESDDFSTKKDKTISTKKLATSQDKLLDY